MAAGTPGAPAGPEMPGIPPPASAPATGIPATEPELPPLVGGMSAVDGAPILGMPEPKILGTAGTRAPAGAGKREGGATALARATPRDWVELPRFAPGDDATPVCS